jgi:hypothetical protein
LPDRAFQWQILNEELRDDLDWLHGLRVKADYYQDQVEYDEASEATVAAEKIVTRPAQGRRSMKRREDVLPRLVTLLDGRPVRWAEPPQNVGDYDGRDRTLEVFNADSGEQRELLRRLRPVRPEIEAIVGGSVVVVFHTRNESC